jgi:tripartite-type tricarboxylate transporter receptor subunit TctC
MRMSHSTRRGRRGGIVRAAALVSATALLLAACGGSDDSSAPAPAPTPPSTDAPAEAEPFYKPGDLVTVILPFGEGGGTDVLARLILPYLGEELGGVNFQVENLPGGGSITGVNTWANQRNSEDGKTLLFHSASSQIPGLLGEEGVLWSFDDQCPIAGFPLGGVIYAKTDGPIQAATQLAGNRQTQRITYGGQPAAGGELRILMIFEMLGTDVNTVLGYGGRGPSRLAWEQGESDLSYDTTPAYISRVQPLVEQGIARPLMSFGFVAADGSIIKDPLLPDLPSPAEVYRQAYGRDISETGDAFAAYRAIALATIALNKSLVGHCSAPAESLEQLRAAMDSLVQKPEVLAAIEAETGGYPVLTFGDVDDAWNQMIGINLDSPELQWMFGWLRDKYDVQIG